MKVYKDFLNENYCEKTGQCKFIDFSMLSKTNGVDSYGIQKFLKSDVNKKFSISLYLYDEKDKAIYPWVVTDEERKFHMDLLIFSPFDNADFYHCALIYDFDKFMRSKTATSRLYFSKRCLCRFYKERCKNRTPTEL